MNPVRPCGLALAGIVTLFVQVSISVTVFAAEGGSMGGGGGKGVLCGEKLEALDLYEAREVLHLKEAPRKSNLEEELNFASDQLYQILFEEEKADGFEPHPALKKMKWMSPWILTQIKFTEKVLPFTDDATLPMLPQDCKFVQIAVFSRQPFYVKINPYLWSKLDTRNQAAILAHEQYFFGMNVFKDYGAKLNSDRTRRLISKAFSVRK